MFNISKPRKRTFSDVLNVVVNSAKYVTKVTLFSPKLRELFVIKSKRLGRVENYKHMQDMTLISNKNVHMNNGVKLQFHTFQLLLQMKKYNKIFVVKKKNLKWC